jgi:nucleoside-diphosphate-sugar epimerase
MRKGDTTMVGDGHVKTGITDLRDVGRFVALIINDSRTLNHFVYTFAEVLTQKEIFKLLEEVSGEVIEPNVACITLPYLTGFKNLLLTFFDFSSCR